MKLFSLITNTLFAIVLALAGLMVASHFGYINFYRPYIVLSGSMEPTIPTGSVAFIKAKPFGYMVGDVITFKGLNSKTPTTHRIIKLEYIDGQLAYQTRGDANEEPDFGLVTPDQVLGSVAFNIPHVGKAADFAQTPQGFILLVIIPATIVIYEEFKTLTSELLALSGKVWKKFKRIQPEEVALIEEPVEPGVKTISFATESLPDPKPHTTKWRLDYRMALIPVVAGLFVTIALSQAYFSDADSRTDNVLGAASNYGEAFANLYADANPICESGASIQAQDFGLVVLDIDQDTVQVDIQASGLNPSESYDLFIHQNPSGCEASTSAGLLLTDSIGTAAGSFTTEKLTNSINYWISIVANGQSFATPVLFPEVD